MHGFYITDERMDEGDGVPPEFLAQAVAAGFLPLRDHRIHAYGCVYN